MAGLETSEYAGLKRGGPKVDSRLNAGLDFVLNVLCFGGFFNLHVTELFGVKNFATLQALDILGVFVPGNDSYPWVLAEVSHRSNIA